MQSEGEKIFPLGGQRVKTSTSAVSGPEIDSVSGQKLTTSVSAVSGTRSRLGFWPEAEDLSFCGFGEQKPTQLRLYSF